MSQSTCVPSIRAHARVILCVYMHERVREIPTIPIPPEEEDTGSSSSQAVFPVFFCLQSTMPRFEILETKLVL